MITKINGTISFEGSATFTKNGRTDECDMLTFKYWAKNGKERIYINDYKHKHRHIRHRKSRPQVEHEHSPDIQHQYGEKDIHVHIVYPHTFVPHRQVDFPRPGLYPQGDQEERRATQAVPARQVKGKQHDA